MVFVGIGPLNRLIRHAIAVITLNFIPYVIFIFTIGLWLAVICLMLFVMGVLNMFFAPFILLLHLVLGIIQLAGRR